MIGPEEEDEDLDILLEVLMELEGIKAVVRAGAVANTYGGGARGVE